MATDFTSPHSYSTRHGGSVGTMRRQTAAGMMANARRIGGVPLLALAGALALLLGTMPQDAKAKACEARPVGLNPGCVIPSDIKKGRGATGVGDLTAKDRMDEAGVAFDASTAVTRMNFISPALGPTKVLASVQMKIPAGGVVIIMASASLTSMKDTKGGVRCDILAAGLNPVNTTRINAFIGTVNETSGFPFDSMSFLYGQELVKKTKLKVDLVCGVDRNISSNVIFGKGLIDLHDPTLTVQYFPTRY